MSRTKADAVTSRLSTLLGPGLRRRLRNLWTGILSRPQRRNLSRLAALHRTDKLSHGYIPIYQRHFQHLRTEKITLLEIGIGGYGNPWAGGGSLRMWAAYFYRGHIFGVDIEDKSPHQARRITVLNGDQSDVSFLNTLVQTTGALDVVVDDGSHFCTDVITSFNFLFAHLKNGGIYVIEDTQTSYWEACGGSMDPAADKTTMNYFKSLADGLNHAEYPQAHSPSDLDRSILSIHFYHNLIVVEKGDNTRPSNVPLVHRQSSAPVV